jgi:ABC-type branched-subunit amino acid transport system permease subunit
MSNVRAILTRMSAAPRARRASRWTGLLLVLAILLVLPLPFQSYQLNWINLALIAAIGALALNLLMGVAGQVSVGNAAFMAIGATVAGGFAHADPTLSPVIVVLIAATVSALVGAVVGIPASTTSSATRSISFRPIRSALPAFTCRSSRWPRGASA